MKYRINITISEEANNKLNLQENKSKYIEDLILSKPTQAAPSGTDLLSIESMLDIRFAALLDVLDKKLAIKPTEEFVPKAPDPNTGYPCCLNEKKPCKHWTWDGVKQSYTNTLTGEVREIYI